MGNPFSRFSLPAFRLPFPGLLLPAFSALLLALASPGFVSGWFAWFALAPLAAAVWRVKSGAAAAASGWLAGFLFYCLHLGWLYPTMRAGGVGPAVSALGLAALSGLLALEFAAVSGFGFRLRRAGAAAWPWVFALAWAVMEFSKVALARGAEWLPWFLLAYTQWGIPETMQAASVGGPWLLSFAVCLTGTMLGAASAPGLKSRSRFFIPLPGLLVFLLLFYFGRVELSRADDMGPARTIKAALLQPNIDLYSKWDASGEAAILSGLDELLAKSRGADLVVWPENALPGWIEDPRYAEWLRTVSALHGAPSVVGSVSRGDGRHVAAFLLDGSGTITESYYKRKLVPFGEYVPAREFLSRRVKPLGAMGDFDPGPERQKLFEAAGVKFAPSICYESIFPYLFKADAGRGARAFVNITYDGWYFDTAAPRQHLAAAAFRAVETRRPVLRAAGTGISAYIDPWGRPVAALGVGERGVLMAEVPIYDEPPKSLYMEKGDWFAKLALMAVAAFALALLFV